MTLAPPDLLLVSCGGIVAATALFACGSRTGFELSASSFEVGPPADAAPPTLDGAPCEGAPSQLSYLLDAVGVLYRFDPSNAATTRLGVPDCGNDNVAWTMTASRENAYIVYTDWTLYAVNLATLVCSPTPFQPGQLGIGDEFGVAISGSGATEKLYVYGETGSGGGPILAVSDLSSFVLTKVGDVLPVPPTTSFPVNLTADSLGHLYAFSPGGLLQQIDASTGAVLQSVQTGVLATSTWASLTSGSSTVFLFADSRVDGYDLPSHTRTFELDIGISAIGGGSVLMCPGQ